MKIFGHKKSIFTLHIDQRLLFELGFTMVSHLINILMTPRYDCSIWNSHTKSNIMGKRVCIALLCAKMDNIPSSLLSCE